jgi:hydrogenase maturation factor
VEVKGEQIEADISLMDEVQVGDILLVHGGVALGRPTTDDGRWNGSSQ